jgi:YfiH family protein
MPGLAAQGFVAAFSGRMGGFSRPPYESLNVGLLVGDERPTVVANRRLLSAAVGRAGTPLAIVYQEHGATVIRVSPEHLKPGPPEAVPALARADGMVTTSPDVVLTVVASDCVPILLADPTARVVSALHAGWRGLAAGVLKAGVDAMIGVGGRPDRIIALVGPAIGPCCYVVGDDVYATITARFPSAAAVTRNGARAIDLATGVVEALGNGGVGQLYVSRECTHDHADRFFSARRDTVTGRQAGMIGLLSDRR